MARDIRTMRLPLTPEPETRRRPPRFGGEFTPQRLTAHEALSLTQDMSATLEDRYQVIDTLGRGGMGEITLATDQHIGRQIAVKTMLPVAAARADEARDRFLNEARVQALLDHPAIVPVYEIGVQGGLPFFTMKRVRGDTFYQLIGDALEHTDRRDAISRRMLSAFVTVCLAVDYAHQRGVLHRDLKPDNIMLGSYGEVYVLDWGVARVQNPGGEGSDLFHTRPGDIVGTPGYMSPEQALGVEELTPASDVFALGTILYEILSLEPLIPGDERNELIALTLNPQRLPPKPANLPPELYSAALKATAFRLEERIGSARELAEQIERFLAGDRDLAQRAKHADERAAEAASNAQVALTGPAHEQAAARGKALQAAASALAVAPGHPSASKTLLTLLATPTKQLPAEVRAEVLRSEDNQLLAAMRGNLGRGLIWVLFLPVVWVLGVRNVPMFAVLAVLICTCALLPSWMLYTRKTPRALRASLFLSASVAGGLLAFVMGPLVFVPGWVAINTALFTAQAPSRHRKWMLLVSIASLAIPLFLELAGVIAPSMHFENGTLTLLPRMVALEPTILLPGLALLSLAGIVVPTLIVLKLRDATLLGQAELIAQRWQLRKLIPEQSAPDK